MLLLLVSLLQAGDVPDRCWDGWWPAVQWSRNASPPSEDAVRGARRSWERIDYPALDTPWGRASVSVGQARKNDAPPTGLRLDLVFAASVESVEKGTVKQPGKGDVDASIVSSAGKLVAKPVSPPEMMGWAGGSLGLSGDLNTEFGWLPQGLDDCWIRVGAGKVTAWLLLPYGLGADPALPPKEIKGKGGSPSRPAEAAPGDVLLAWQRVRYDLGWMDDKGKVDPALPSGLEGEARSTWIRDRIHVTASVSNPFDGAVDLELYRERFEKWSMAKPRTTVAIGVPGSRVFFGSLDELRRDDALRRYDGFKMWRQGGDRRWGLLRVTLEETVFEVALPGSLFLYTHGRIPE